MVVISLLPIAETGSWQERAARHPDEQCMRRTWQPHSHIWCLAYSGVPVKPKAPELPDQHLPVWFPVNF